MSLNHLLFFSFVQPLTSSFCEHTIKAKGEPKIKAKAEPKMGRKLKAKGNDNDKAKAKGADATSKRKRKRKKTKAKGKGKGATDKLQQDTTKGRKKRKCQAKATFLAFALACAFQSNGGQRQGEESAEDVAEDKEGSLGEKDINAIAASSKGSTASTIDIELKSVNTDHEGETLDDINGRTHHCENSKSQRSGAHSLIPSDAPIEISDDDNNEDGYMSPQYY